MRIRRDIDGDSWKNAEFPPVVVVIESKEELLQLVSVLNVGNKSTLDKIKEQWNNIVICFADKGWKLPEYFHFRTWNKPSVVLAHNLEIVLEQICERVNNVKIRGKKEDSDED